MIITVTINIRDRIANIVSGNNNSKYTGGSNDEMAVDWTSVFMQSYESDVACKERLESDPTNNYDLTVFVSYSDVIAIIMVRCK